MIADEQDRTVTRLRHELGAVGVRSHADQVDRVLRRVHTRRREQRQHRIQMATALAVVLIAVAGAFVVGWRQSEQDQITATEHVVDWGLRGDLAGNAEVVRHAETVWRSGPTPPTGRVYPVYAGRHIERSASLVVVALVTPVDRMHSRVAFVTSPISDNQTPDVKSLSVRATTVIGAGQRAIGFLNARTNPRDARLRGGGGLGFILAEPGVTDVTYRSSLVDAQLVETPVRLPDGAGGFVTQQGVAAWNSIIEIPGGPTPATANFAAGISEASVVPVTLAATGTEIKVTGDVRDGDLIVTANGVVGLVGVVTGSDGTLETRLSELRRFGEVETAITKHPVRLSERDGGTYFEAERGEIRAGNRIVLVVGDVTINIGKVAEDGARVERLVDPTTTTVAMRVRPS